MMFISLLFVLLFATDAIVNAQGRVAHNNRPLPWNVSAHIRPVGYVFSSNIDKLQRDLLEQSMREIEQAVNVEGHDTCISFRKRSRENHYVYIRDTDSGLCIEKDETATGSGREYLHLRFDCMDKRDMISSLLVIIGLFHEHQRPDRDQYIQVHMDNVQDDARNAFNKIPFTNSSPLGFRYDFDSITHYGPYEYAKNASLPTISTNVSGIRFGYSDRLSWYDVLKVRALYGCTGYKMFEGHATNAFTQPSPADHYPQWFESSEHHLYNHDQRCSKETSDQYLVTILHNATLMSSFTIPPGNFCVSVDYCIASCYHDSQSYIGLTTDGGISLEDMKSSGSQGHWETALMNVDADQGWRLNVTAHVLSGGDLLALDKVIVLSGQCA